MPERPRASRAPAGGEGKRRPPGQRQAYFGRRAGWIETPVLGRSDLAEARVGAVHRRRVRRDLHCAAGARASLDDKGNIAIEMP